MRQPVWKNRTCYECVHLTDEPFGLGSPRRKCNRGGVSGLEGVFRDDAACHKFTEKKSSPA